LRPEEGEDVWPYEEAERDPGNESELEEEGETEEEEEPKEER
jgi:hypothetical protein